MSKSHICTRTYQQSSWDAGQLQAVMLEIQQLLKATDLHITLGSTRSDGRSTTRSGGINLVSELTEIPTGRSSLSARYIRKLSDSEMVSHADVLTLNQLGGNEVVLTFSAVDKTWTVELKSSDAGIAKDVYGRLQQGLSLQDAA